MRLSKQLRLSKPQKELLFKKGYINDLALDVDTESSWQNYFIECFNWDLIDVGEKNVKSKVWHFKTY